MRLDGVKRQQNPLLLVNKLWGWRGKDQKQNCQRGNRETISLYLSQLLQTHKRKQTAPESKADNKPFPLPFYLCWKSSVAWVCQLPHAACSGWNRTFQYPQEHATKVSIYTICQIWSVSAVTAFPNASWALYLMETRLGDHHDLQVSQANTSHQLCHCHPWLRHQSSTERNEQGTQHLWLQSSSPADRPQCRHVPLGKCSDVHCHMS